jgi:thiol:disulfide interchange protein
MSKPIQLVDLSTTDDLMKQLNKHARGKLCVVMFTASWCGPCQNIKREIYNESKSDGLTVKYKDSVVFFYVDIEKNSELASEFGISSIPVFQFIVCKGQEVEFVSGKIMGGNKSRLVETIEKALQ